jgi:hypothetical protein
MSQRATHLALALYGSLLGSSCDQAARPLVCGSEQILGADGSGHQICVVAPNGAVTPPKCPEALTSDGRQLLCASLNKSVDRDADVRAAVGQLETATDHIQRRLTPSIELGTYVGNSKFTTNGLIVSDNQVGIIAASAVCASQFGAGAHMCVMDELYQAVIDGRLGTADTIPLAWVYMPNWNSPEPNPVEPLRGQADSCGGYTYPTASRNWRGILVEWSPLLDGSPSFRWHGGVDAACYGTHPIACCK